MAEILDLSGAWRCHIRGSAEHNYDIDGDRACLLPMLLLDVPYMLEKSSFFMKKGETVTIRKQPIL